MNKNMRAGYQGKKDSMREMADRLMNHPGHAKDIYFSKSAADKEPMRPFKEGGFVNKNDLLGKEKKISKQTRISTVMDMKDKEDAKKKKHEDEIKHEKKLVGSFPIGIQIREKVRVKPIDEMDGIALEKKLLGGRVAGSQLIEKIRKLPKEKIDHDDYDYKKGGSVKKCNKREKFADGGAVYKIRMDQMTPDGKQKGTKKVSLKNSIYY